MISMNIRRKRLSIILGFIFILIFTININAEELETRISLSYREKIAIHPISSAEVFLIDQNANQKEDLIIREEKKEIGGQIPVDFNWILTDISSDKNYVLQSIIKSETGDMLWFNSKHVKGDILNKGENLDIILKIATADKKTFESEKGDIKLRYLDNMMQVFIDEQEFILHQQRTASGAKYINDNLTIWNKGEEILVEYKGEFKTILNCEK